MSDAPDSASDIRRTFLDPALQHRFARDGFVVTPLLGPDRVAELRALFSDLNDLELTGFQTDFERADPTRKQAIHDAVAAAAVPVLASILDRHRPFMATFLAKWPGEGSSLYLHQDWCYVDERQFRSVVVWVALDDIGPEQGNGPLSVLPGSHRITGEFRGTATTHWYVDISDPLLEGLIPVAVPAGHAVIMDNALVHASSDNGTDVVRVAAALGCVPEEAPLLHAVALGDDAVEVLTVDEDFFRDETPTSLRAAVSDRWRSGSVQRPTRWYEPDLELASRLSGRRLPEDASRPPLGPSAPPEPGRSLLSRVSTSVVAVNHRRIAAASSEHGPFHPTERFSWIASLERAAEAIAEEYLAARDRDHLEAPLSALADEALPNIGAWRALLLRDNRGWAPEARHRCPTTCHLLDQVPGIRSALFSTLGPWAQIAPHRGPNNGVLRAHLGVITPEAPGRATLWAGSESRSWEQGQAFVFDDTFEHRVANQSPDWRVSLMVEFDRPLTGSDRYVNTVVQTGFRWHPQVRGAKKRRLAIQRALNA